MCYRGFPEGFDPGGGPSLFGRGDITMPAEMIRVNQAKMVHETIDNEVIIINLETGTYYNIVDTGVEVWRLVEQGISRPQLLEAMAYQYAADRDTVVSAVNAFLDELLGEEIIVAEIGDGQSNLTMEGDKKIADTAFTPPTLSTYTNMSDLLLLDPIHDVDEQGWPKHKQQS
jgi:hypothetical protein